MALFTILWTSAAIADEAARYTVRRGDNLSVIAARLGVSVADLRRDNGLSGDLIRVDQRLRIQRPFHRQKDGDIAWGKPLERRVPVLREFGPYQNQQGVLMPSTGVDLGAGQGTVVLCPAHGVIRYIGVQEGFGNLVIVEHGAGWTTVFAPLDPATIKWRENEVVWRGDPLGRTDAPVEGDRPYLHLELRRRQRAVEPGRLLR